MWTTSSSKLVKPGDGGGDCYSVQATPSISVVQGLVFSVIEHTLALPTFSGTQVDRVERIKNEAIKTILGCTRDTAIAARGCLLDMTTIC